MTLKTDIMSFDASRALRTLESRGGPHLEVTGRPTSGQFATAYVRWPDGHRSVLKWRGGSGFLATHSRSFRVVKRLRELGYPVPEYEFSWRTGGGIAVVMEAIDSHEPYVLTHRLLDTLLDLMDRQRGAMSRRAAMPLYLLVDGPGYCQHESLHHLGRDGERLHDWITETGFALGDSLSGRDAVHYDFHTGNMLVDADDPDRLAGIVDWDGACAGDASLDLVELLFAAENIRCEPGVKERLRAAVAALPGATRQKCWAHLSLRFVDWTARNAPTEADRWLAFALSGV